MVTAIVLHYPGEIVITSGVPAGEEKTRWWTRHGVKNGSSLSLLRLRMATRKKPKRPATAEAVYRDAWLKETWITCRPAASVLVTAMASPFDVTKAPPERRRARTRRTPP